MPYEYAFRNSTLQEINFFSNQSVFDHEGTVILPKLFDSKLYVVFFRLFRITL